MNCKTFTRLNEADHKKNYEVNKQCKSTVHIKRFLDTFINEYLFFKVILLGYLVIRTPHYLTN